MQLAVISLAVAVSFEVAKGSGTIVALSSQLKKTRSYLYHGAVVLLLLSVAGASSVLWAASFLPVGENSEALSVQKLALGVAMDAGVYNLILLVFVFSPAILTLTGRVPTILRSTLSFGSNDEERAKVLETHGIVTSPTDYYWQAASLLSPLLGGVPLTAMLAFLLK